MSLSEEIRECPSCKSKGFEKSVLGPDRCTFCDGTFSGNPPTEEEIRNYKTDGEVTPYSN